MGEYECLYFQVKPRHIDRRYRNYTPDVLLKAYEAVVKAGTPVKRAAVQFGVPVQTLRDRVKGHIDPVSFQVGGETILKSEEEETLVEHVEIMAQLGYGYSNIQLQHLAGELAYDLGKRTSMKALSNNWLYGFLNRWEHRLVSLNPRKLETTRAKSSTPETVNKYFENLSEIITKYNLCDKPQNIYNIDETGLQPEHRPPNVIANPNTKPQAITSPRSTTTTLIGCANALGNALPPFFVFKGKRYNPELMKGATTGAEGVMSESGWSNSDIFKQYLQDHFLPYVRTQASSSEPILLIFDGHASHVSPSLIEWANNHNIILFVLPAHTSHLLQPLDVAMFGPFKSFYYTECAIFMRNHIGQSITKYDMCSMACKAYLKAFTPINIQSGFRKTGIYPFSKDVIDKEKLFPSECFREDQPLEKVKAIKTGKDAVEEFLKLKVERIQSAKSCQECNTCKNLKRSKESNVKPKPGGTAITEKEFTDKMKTYKDKNEVKKSTKCQKIQNKTTLKTSPISPKPSTSGILPSPKPSTSGISGKPTSTSLQHEDMSDDEDDATTCCVCKQKSPPSHNNLQFLKIITWAKCDVCDHWVHLAFCTPVRVVRRHSEFLCPHCDY